MEKVLKTAALEHLPESHSFLFTHFSFFNKKSRRQPSGIFYFVKQPAKTDFTADLINTVNLKGAHVDVQCRLSGI